MPERPYNMLGYRFTDKVRLAPTLFGARLERLAEYEDGSRKWMPARAPLELNPGVEP